MKKRVLLFVLFLSTFLWAGDKSKDIYSLDVFEKSSAYKERVDEVLIKKFDLALLKVSSLEKDVYGTKEESISLDKPLNNILDILDDKSFQKEYNLTELTLFIYNKNRVLMEFCHSDDIGFFCQKELVILEKKILKRKGLGVTYGSYASSNSEEFNERIIDDHNNTRFWKCRKRWKGDAFSLLFQRER